jgi:hypothetical protein
MRHRNLSTDVMKLKSITRQFACGKNTAQGKTTIEGILPGDRAAHEAFQAAEGGERTRLFRANRLAICRWQKVLESGSRREATKAAGQAPTPGGRNVAPSPAVAPKPAASVQALASDPLAGLRADLRKRFPSPEKDIIGQVRFALSHCAKVVAAVPGRFLKGSKTNELRTAKAALTILREKQ